MKRSRIRITILLSAAALLAGMVLPVHSAVPRKQPLGRYAELWTKSPFTVPPVIAPTVKDEANPLDDYTLAGVCQIKGGWFVVLINKKQRGDRIRIKPNETNTEGFKVVSVRNGTKYKDTKVEIAYAGNKTAWVEYDDKFMVLKKATAAPARGKPGSQPKPGGKPGTARPPMPSASGGQTPRPSRVRRIPTPPQK